MLFENLKRLTVDDRAFLEDLYRHHHGESKQELIDCFTQYHNALMDSGFVTYSVHEGDIIKKGKYTRAGLTYKTPVENNNKVTQRAAICFNIDKVGFQFLFFRKGGAPYPGHNLVSYSEKDWSGFEYLTPSTLQKFLAFSEESLKLLNYSIRLKTV